jgi:hypothetical protein
VRGVPAEVVELDRRDAGVAADLKPGSRREEDDTTRGVGVEEVGRQIVGGGEPVGDAVPVDLAAATREDGAGVTRSAAHTIVGAEEVPELLNRDLDVGGGRPGRLEDEGARDAGRGPRYHRRRRDDEQPFEHTLHPLAERLLVACLLLHRGLSFCSGAGTSRAPQCAQQSSTDGGGKGFPAVGRHPVARVSSGGRNLRRPISYLIGTAISDDDGEPRP